MGFFSGMSAINAVQKIARGGKARLSVAKICDLLINLQEAEKNLPRKEFNEILNLYRKMQTHSGTEKLDWNGYVAKAIQIIDHFDRIAPYEKYSGGSEREFEVFLDEMREKRAEEDKQAARGTIAKTLHNTAEIYFNNANGVIKDFRDAVEFVALFMYPEGELLPRFDEFKNRLMNKYGAVESIMEVSFFIGVMCNEGYINEVTMERMREQFCDEALKKATKG